MRVRSEQINALSQQKVDSFEDRMEQHLLRCFPGECAALGSEGVRETIRYGIERASSYGIDLERDVCKYIDLMFAFGRDFDRSPESSWAGPILTDPAYSTGTEKIEQVYAAAKSHSVADQGNVL